MAIDAPTTTIDAPANSASVVISPAMPKTNDSLNAMVLGIPAGTFSVRWTQNGTVRTDLAGTTVDSALTTRGDVWKIDVLANSNQAIVASAMTTIINTPPPAPTVTLNPATPAPGVGITCHATATSPDADGDTVTFTGSWMKNGVPYTTATKTVFPGDTVAAADVKVGDNWMCTVAATDSMDTTDASSATVAAQCITGGSQDFAVNGTNEVGSLQMFTVPPGVCSITIDVGGAHGGSGNTNGATMIGTFAVTGGTQYKVLVGQQAAPAGSLAGGGGTFVTTTANAPVIIAGGGGSNFSGTITDDELEGRAVTSGGIGAGATRADNGAGGTVLNATSGGGGGLLTNGANSGGFAFVNGGAGNAAGTPQYHSGYGGGGARDVPVNSGSFGEGGGGGYSGGSCGNLISTWVGCGGGGSYNGGTNQVNTAGANAGDGYVKITW